MPSIQFVQINSLKENYLFISKMNLKNAKENLKDVATLSIIFKYF